jgi:hypothetical protein
MGVMKKNSTITIDYAMPPQASPKSRIKKHSKSAAVEKLSASFSTAAFL